MVDQTRVKKHESGMVKIGESIISFINFRCCLILIIIMQNIYLRLVETSY